VTDPATPYYRIRDETSFRIQRELARGGMGAVYEAYQLGVEGFEKRVALKVLLQNLSADEEFVAMFIQEAVLVADLVHENVVQIYQLGYADGTYYMSLEFIDGVTLGDFLKRHEELGRKIPAELAAFIVSRMCRALEYAHTKLGADGTPLGIVHRDISPGNVMLTFSGVAKLTDFGIAKARLHKLDLEGEVLLGKVRYMSPEQARFEVTDLRSDLFSVGVVFYQLLLGEQLFKGEDTIATLQEVTTSVIPPLLEVAPHVSPALASIVDRALKRPRGERYPSAGQMGFDIEKFMYGDRFGPTNLSLHRYLGALYPDRVQNWIDPSVPDPYFERLGLEL
jgi:serine/threonine protein kinase